VAQEAGEREDSDEPVRLSAETLKLALARTLNSRLPPTSATTMVVLPIERTGTVGRNLIRDIGASSFCLIRLPAQEITRFG
jgi:hypothetical protein